MRRATILDLPYIVKLLLYGREDLCTGIEWYYSIKLRNAFDNYYYVNEDRTLLFMFERLSNFRLQLHTYSMPNVRGIEYKQAFKKTISILKENVLVHSVITFIEEDNKRAIVAARHGGFKQIGQCLNKDYIYEMEI